MEDGVSWIPIGPKTGTKIDRLSYFPLLGPQVARRRHDLVVEDFGAPFSVGLSPLFTRAPVVASVQWLFAQQMRERYHLPFDLVEKHGLRLYDRFIAVSGWLAEVIRQRRPGTTVQTIPNGVEEAAYEVEQEVPEYLLFVGRLDAQKGVDLLSQIMHRMQRLARDRTPRLVIVGDGPDRGMVENLARRSNLSDLIEFRGRVEGPEKYRLMAGAHAVLMPSRFETFGMVATESLATGTPLVAFDVGPLSEVVGEGTGARLVPPYDIDAFAREALRFVEDRGLREHVRDTGRRWARRYDWEDISLQQEEFYERVLREGRKARVKGSNRRTAGQGET